MTSPEMRKKEERKKKRKKERKTQRKKERKTEKERKKKKIVSIYYKISLFDAHTMNSILHIFMNVNKLCLNQSKS